VLNYLWKSREGLKGEWMWKCSELNKNMTESIRWLNHWDVRDTCNMYDTRIWPIMFIYYRLVYELSYLYIVIKITSLSISDIYIVTDIK